MTRQFMEPFSQAENSARLGFYRLLKTSDLFHDFILPGQHLLSLFGRMALMLCLHCRNDDADE